MKTIKLAVFAIHRPFRAPNERYRFEQYKNYLYEKNININYFYILNDKEDAILFYSKNYFLKIFIYLKTYFKRWWQIITLKKSHTILIYRELHWFGFHTKLWMHLLKLKSKKIIFDFDDAIWIESTSTVQNIIKKPSHKTPVYIKQSNTIIAGNKYLCNYAQSYNSNCIIIPTVIDTDYFIPIPHIKNQQQNITIGWMGSHSTVAHLKQLIPVLKQIQHKYPNIKFKFIGKKEFLPELNVYIEDWNKNTEIQTLNSFDIGIMPLPNDEWSKGKCGLKLLTYMACEIPCIASNIGVNKEIIEKTSGGLLCNNEQDWLHNLSLLIQNPELRQQLGAQGRKNVEKYYSLKAWKEKFFNTLFA